ncbi:MAG: glutathione S-transferase family protein [Gammaproteobacteria bacterium]|jgi:glutathione S-transferase|nr:glutathione S-transferase [Gammaproteobacteria bacterium]MBQ09716.1 glutathione S-transferase [Gammaproteobacteria bacterium]MDP6147071.1 glutathione S-transferase family protein [Gammaproteobacteria bacterium]HJL79575.1 glutathione S-transferase family protein [Gammaproteobacteria bacterium]HJM09718.1 glutathione S-transferase family protein [Gammaproteobacteria bacterium]|tara:strand:- start:7412 stop:8074 length:663 start_codon:yes stop_codon:yes gene_type:complete
METIKIYSSARCPYAQRTRMLMIEKELSFELIEVDLRNKPDWFLSISPYGKVPVVVDDGETIYESAIINEYLDEKYEDIPLMPKEPFERAEARIWMDYCTNKYLVLSRKLLTDNGNDELQSQNKEKLKQAMIYMEKECFEKNESGAFWLGENISLVDLHYAPFFERFSAFKELFGVEWPEECLKIKGWWKEMQERDSYKMTVLPTDQHIDLYQSIMRNMS